MKNLEMVTVKERAKYLAEEFGSKIEVKEYSESCNLIVFKEEIDSYTLLILFQTGIRYGHENLAKAFGC